MRQPWTSQRLRRGKQASKQARRPQGQDAKHTPTTRQVACARRHSYNTSSMSLKRKAVQGSIPQTETPDSKRRRGPDVSAMSLHQTPLASTVRPSHRVAVHLRCSCARRCLSESNSLLTALAAAVHRKCLGNAPAHNPGGPGFYRQAQGGAGQAVCAPASKQEEGQRWDMK